MGAMHPQDGDGRVFGLDLLRACAIVAVVYGHGEPLLESAVRPQAYELFAFEGVTPFFVLSGFLIGRILLGLFMKGMDGPGLARFWVRRWFRTLPAYALVLLVLLAIGDLLPGHAPGTPAAPYFAFLQNFAWHHPAFFPEAWSLAVEEWFYLLTPLGLLLCARRSGVRRERLALVFVLAVLVATTAFRLWRVRQFGYADIDGWDRELRKQVVTRFDSLMFGVLGAYASLFWAPAWQRWRRPLLAAGCALLLLDKFLGGVVVSQSYLNYFALSLAPFAVMLMLPFLSAWQPRAGIAVRMVTTLSVISYSMYLLHYSIVQHTVLPALSGACPACGDQPWLRYAMYWGLTLAGAWLLYTYFERPCTALRDRVGRPHREVQARLS